MPCLEKVISFPPTQVLDRVLEAPLPYKVSRALLCAHARLLEGLASGYGGIPWVEELCLLANQVIPRWKCLGLTARDGALHLAASDDEEVKDASAGVLQSFYDCLVKVPNGDVQATGKNTIGEELWKELLSERGVRYFSAWRVGEDNGGKAFFLILVSDYQEVLKEHESRAMSLIAAIASLAVTQTEAPTAKVEPPFAPVKPLELVSKNMAKNGRGMTQPKPNVADLDQIEKDTFEALSIFAAGVAHDMNNILTALVGNVSLANMLISDVPEASSRLVEAERACFRAKDLAHQLLSFSQGAEPVKKTAQLEDVLKQCTDFYLRDSKSIPKVIAPDDLWSACLDEVQISQAIENLITHADNMMPAGGIITLRCENFEYEGAKAEKKMPLKNGRYITLKVQDQGAPLPAEHLPHVFKPYVMNKEMGNGLHLATTYTIVKNHGGHITATTSSEGNEMTIYLPATEEAKTNHSTKSNAKKSGRILIVDDEKSIRDLATATLKMMGCQVVSCPSSSEGVNTFLEARQNGEPFDLVIMDLSIPGDLGGNEAMQQILKIAPDALGIASSGYSDGSIMTHYREYGFRAALSKPYNITDLQRIVSSMLHN